ncbi:MAG: DNA repair protein RadA, partial [Bacteroidetes bacterium]|nr:DNA repair protein RadA [Bacteroidota bacterium]
MAKSKTVFVCQSCGTESLKWQGQCAGCKEWGTLVEEIISSTSKRNISNVNSSKSEPKTLAQIESSNEKRLITKDLEMNRVLGGGIVDGSV